jgi:hypothetical protein
VYVDEIDKRGSVFVDLILLLNLHFKNKKKKEYAYGQNNIHDYKNPARNLARD